MIKNDKIFDAIRDDGDECPVCGYPIKDMKCEHCGYPYNQEDADGDNLK